MSLQNQQYPDWPKNLEIELVVDLLLELSLGDDLYVAVAVALYVDLVATVANEDFVLFEDLKVADLGRRKRRPKREFTSSDSLTTNSTKCEKFARCPKEFSI